MNIIPIDAKRLKEEQAEKERKHQEAITALRNDPQYSHLKQIPPGQYVGAAFAAANIRAELKKAFPGIKFSIRSKSFSGGDSINVNWTDGPLTKDVKAIANQYSGGSFNGMEDIYEYRHSAWIDVFGDAKYISCDRAYSVAAMQEAVSQVCRDFGWEPLEVKTHLDGSAYIHSDDSDRYCHVYDFLEKRNHYEPEPSVSDAPEPTTQTEPIAPIVEEASDYDEPSPAQGELIPQPRQKGLF